MKKYILFLGISLLAGSCMNNDFLEVYPQDKQTELTAFRTYDNFKAYAWGLYNTFNGYGKDWNNNSVYNGDFQADNMISHVAGSESQWGWQTVKVPAKSDNWNYSYIRRVNLMLGNIDQSDMSDTEKEHWRSVGYFFRSYKYFDMLSRFGDIPWVDRVLSDDDELLYAPRDSRDVVASNILNDLKYAEEHIKKDGDGQNTINKSVVQALISRFALFEGTWRKYHSLSDAEMYLKECERVSSVLVKEYPVLHPRYEELFNMEDLSGVDGVLLFKAYAATQLMHGLTRSVRTGESTMEVSKDAVDSYLCSDGQPIGSSPLYGGDKDVYAQFRNRDYRLYHTVCPPYQVKVATNSPVWEYTDNLVEREYIDLMATISGPTYHNLPTANFKGFVTRGQPHFKGNNWGMGWQTTYMGFWFWKYYNTHTDATGAVNTTDAPLFRMGEVMLNYAEVKAELGTFDQTVADVSINKLRARAGVAPMTVADINASFDPARDPDISPLLWEIRRERRVELFGEGFRFDDLRRWKKATYINKQPVGVYVGDGSTAPSPGASGKVTGEGYAYFFNPPKGWQEHYYLYPLPLNQLALNKNLKQNSGWDN